MLVLVLLLLGCVLRWRRLQAIRVLMLLILLCTMLGLTLLELTLLGLLGLLILVLLLLRVPGNRRTRILRTSVGVGIEWWCLWVQR
jgi:hypothetical protein